MNFTENADKGAKRILERLGTTFEWKGKTVPCSISNGAITDVFADLGGGTMQDGGFILSVRRAAFPGNDKPQTSDVVKLNGRQWAIHSITDQDNASPFISLHLKDE